MHLEIMWLKRYPVCQEQLFYHTFYLCGKLYLPPLLVMFNYYIMFMLSYIPPVYHIFYIEQHITEK